MRLACLAFAAILCCGSAAGQWQPSARFNGEIAWQWSQPADHHTAVCRVRSDTLSGGGYPSGSGVLVTTEGCVGVLTAAHVIRQGRSATVTFSNGQRISGRCTTDKNNHDVGWIQLPQKPTGIEPLPVSPPEIGQVEMCGFGGPTGKLRHYWAQLDKQSNHSVAVGKVTATYGDSGGPWIQQGKVVGINSTTGDTSGSPRHATGPNGQQWVIGNMSHSASGEAIQSFLHRVCRSGFG